MEAGAKGADALSGGIGKVTSQISDAITDLDTQVGVSKPMEKTTAFRVWSFGTFGENFRVGT